MWSSLCLTPIMSVLFVQDWPSFVSLLSIMWMMGVASMRGAPMVLMILGRIMGMWVGVLCQWAGGYGRRGCNLPTTNRRILSSLGFCPITRDNANISPTLHMNIAIIYSIHNSNSNFLTSISREHRVYIQALDTIKQPHYRANIYVVMYMKHKSTAGHKFSCAILQSCNLVERLA